MSSFLYSQFFCTPTYPAQSFIGQTVIVTGSNVGLGKEAARHFARLNAAKVILAVRNTQAGEDARQDILSTTNRSPDVVEVWELDLGKYESVKSFADRATRELKRIDVLLENAGMSTEDFQLAEGHERTITVNVISTFLLALLMLPKLERCGTEFGIKPRLTIVSSEVHGWAKFPQRDSPNGIFKALSTPETAVMSERYFVSKLLELLVVRQIAPKLASSGVVLNMLNPGLCHSELTREDSRWFVWAFKAMLARTTEVGSRTLVAAATAGEESHGAYMSDGVVKQYMVSPFAQSADGELTGKKVWAELQDILEKVQPGVTKGL